MEISNKDNICQIGSAHFNRELLSPCHDEKKLEEGQVLFALVHQSNDQGFGLFDAIFFSASLFLKVWIVF